MKKIGVEMIRNEMALNRHDKPWMFDAMRRNRTAVSSVRAVLSQCDKIKVIGVIRGLAMWHEKRKKGRELLGERKGKTSKEDQQKKRKEFTGVRMEMQGKK